MHLSCSPNLQQIIKSALSEYFGKECDQSLGSRKRQRSEIPEVPVRPGSKQEEYTYAMR